MTACVIVGLNLCLCTGKKDNANTRMVSVRRLVSLCPVTQTKQGVLTIVQMRKRRLRTFSDLFTFALLRQESNHSWF